MSRPDEREAPPRTALARLFLQEDLNFLLTNRIPRRAATQLMARFGRIRSRRLTRLTIAVWQRFADDLRLEEAEEREFESLHDCFVRRLRPGARPIDPDPHSLVSPCDAIVGAHGPLRGVQAIQAKDLWYGVDELVVDPDLAARFRDGYFITLRLQSNMYHRFHAPTDGRVRAITYVEGDTWNVNPIALARVERLFCKNERAVVEFDTAWPDTALALVPVAAVLVGGIRFGCLAEPLTLSHRGRTRFACDAGLRKGEELGRFEAGSTIVLLTRGPLAPTSRLRTGTIVRVGDALMRRTSSSERTSPSDAPDAAAPRSGAPPAPAARSTQQGAPP
jgi:phosphatidylserine decarboxylase